MAGSPQVVRSIAAAASMPALTLNSRVRPLRDAGLIRLDGRGLAAGRVNVDASEMTLIVLALAAPIPGRAVELISALGALTWQDRQVGDWATVGDELAAELTKCARRILRGELPDTGSNWCLNVCCDPLTAWLTWVDTSGH